MYCTNGRAINLRDSSQLRDFSNKVFRQLAAKREKRVKMRKKRWMKLRTAALLSAPFHVQSVENRTTVTLNPLCAGNREDLSLVGIPTFHGEACNRPSQVYLEHLLANLSVRRENHCS